VDNTRGRVVNVFELDTGEEEAPATVFFLFVCPGVHVTKPIEEKEKKEKPFEKKEGNVYNVKQGWNVDLFFTANIDRLLCKRRKKLCIVRSINDFLFL
jgi:hypothetical protein